MDATREFFDSWAPFYDANYGDRDIGDEDFYLELARQTDGPVLEVGCGTGRIYLELLRAGVDADGIDISGEMLAELERKARDAELTPTVRKADMIDFAPEREYGLVIVPFRTFLHNITLESRLAALETFRGALRPGGKLALNCFVPSFAVICETYGTPKHRTVTHEGDVYDVTEVSEIVDEVEQTVSVTRTIRQDGDVLREATFDVALVSKSQFELLFETTGWSDWEGYGGFDGEPLEDGATEMVWIAEA